MTDDASDNSSEHTFDVTVTPQSSGGQKQEFRVTSKQQVDRFSSGWLDDFVKWATIFSLVLIPLILAFSGYRLEEAISKRTIKGEYVNLAVEVLNNKDANPYIRTWAVDLFVQNSTIDVPPNAVEFLRAGGMLVPEPEPVQGPVTFTSYMVQEGDTLDSIRQRFNTSPALIAKYGITADSLIPGSVIQLPVGNPEFCSRLRPYVVVAEDTFAELAKGYGTAEELLREINGFSPDAPLFEAAVICVP